MCGICGIINLAEQNNPDSRILERMLSQLKHRGPDDRGIAIFHGVGLGHTRLSIIDPEGGHQPMFNENHQIVTVLNGEIYNAPDLSIELKQKGHLFKSHSDTEVLLHLYEEEGIDFLSRLNGMFALAIFDRQKRKIILARDRFGVKPMVYGWAGDGSLVFASEIKALKAHPGISEKIDPEALAVYLGLFYIPDPWTIYQNIRKLKPGHFLEISEYGFREGVFVKIEFREKIDTNRKEAAEETYRLFKRAVKRQLLSDVPVGALLSGGMDSRMVLAEASKFFSADSQINAFTIGFDEALYDESKPAAVWSLIFGAKHHRFSFNEENFLQSVESRMQGLDEPYALWVNVASNVLAGHIHRNGIKVVLSGEGGDELFCGYPTLHAANVARLYRLIPQWIRTKMIKPACHAMPAGKGRLPMAFMLQSFVDSDHPDIIRNFFGFKEVIRRQEWLSLLTPDALKFVAPYDPAAAFYQYENDIREMSLIDALSYLDFKVFLPGCSFVGNDNAYMANSVETRVPMMDNDLVAFVTALPTRLRFHPLKLKSLLRDAHEILLSQLRHNSVRHFRRVYRKAGFEVPINNWINQGPVSRWLDGVLAGHKIDKTGFFRTDAVARVLKDQRNGLRNNERIIQSIVCLELFLRRNPLS